MPTKKSIQSFPAKKLVQQIKQSRARAHTYTYTRETRRIKKISRYSITSNLSSEVFFVLASDMESLKADCELKIADLKIRNSKSPIQN